MERGTEWEYEAVRDKWAAMEHQQRMVERLLAGGSLGLFGIVLLMLAAATKTCIGDNGIVPRCAPVTTGPIDLVFGLAGVITLVCGLSLCWSALQK